MGGLVILVANVLWVRPGRQYVAGLAGIVAWSGVVYAYRRVRRPVARPRSDSAPWVALAVMITVTVAFVVIRDAFSGDRGDDWLVLGISAGVKRDRSQS